MKKICKLLYILTLLFIFKSKCSALTYNGCNYKVVANLKKAINNINVSYTYEIRDNEAYFDVIINNILDNMYFIDSKDGKKYTYSDTINGELIIRNYNNIQDGKYTFYVDNKECSGVKLGNKYYKFPVYNKRRNSDACKDIPNYNLCKRWLSKIYSDAEFEKNINKYKKSLEESNEGKIEIKYEKSLMDKIVEFYIKYYYYFLPAIILPCIIIIIISNRKNKFKL